MLAPRVVRLFWCTHKIKMSQGPSPKGLTPSSAQNDEAEQVPPYCVLPQREKLLCILLASLTAILGPLSGNIYLPATNPLSRDLHTSHSIINLSVTVFLVRCVSGEQKLSWRVLVAK